MVVAHARVLADRVLHRRWNLRGRRDRFLPPDYWGSVQPWANEQHGTGRSQEHDRTGSSGLQT